MVSMNITKAVYVYLQKYRVGVNPVPYTVFVMCIVRGACVHVLGKGRVFQGCPHIVGLTQTRSKIHLHMLLVQIDIYSCWDMYKAHVCKCCATGKFCRGAYTS